MRGLVEGPERRLSELPLLTEGERAQLLAEWNDTGAEPAWEGPVHELFARCAERYPTTEALIFEGTTLTYGELSRRAGRLAAWLRVQGAGLESRVGVCVEPSPEMIVSLLGILKAGASYVPLDPAYPRERLVRMLEDSGVELLLTQERFRSTLPGKAALLCLDSEWGVVEAMGPEMAQTEQVTAKSAAYMIYTSGSTGTPKGVVAVHGGLASFTRSMVEALALAPGDRVLQFASLSFDASAVQIFPTLASGAALVLHRNPRALSTRELLELCSATRVTVLDLPAALWRQWVGEGMESEIAAPIRMYMTGGEAVPAPVLRAWASRMEPAVGFLSSYGPTEATVTSTVFQTTSGEVDRLALPEVPLGRPLPGTGLYLLDGGLQPVPVGVLGEVFLAGAGVTRGYLHHPGLTAERYLPDPWSGEPGARVYRAGDLARRLPDGSLQFAGRRDQQVKLRGYRVELGEIEASLGACPGVREKVVVVRGEAAGDRRLVAYVVPERPDELSAEDLLAMLRTMLPAHMVPSSLVLLPQLPLTPSGKIDRKALPAFDASSLPQQRQEIGPVRTKQEIVPAQTQLELDLVHLWEELLDVRPIGIHDNFFDLGGHSLLTVRLVAQIGKKLGRRVPLAVLFEGPTISHLARRLAAEEVAPAWSPLVAIQPAHSFSKPPLFFVHPLGGEVLAYYHLARHLGTDQPFYALQAATLHHQGGEPHPSIEEMAARYLAEVRKVQPQGSYMLGGSSFGGLVAFEMAQQLRGQGEKVALLAMLDTPVPVNEPELFDLDSAALIPALLRQQARGHGRELRLTPNELRGLLLEEQVDLALGRAKEAGILGGEIDAALLHRFIRGYEPRMRAMQRYRARPYPGSIDLFRPHELDPEELRHASAERRKRLADPALGWGAFAAGGVEVCYVPGQHETMTAEPHVRELAKALKSRIGQVAEAEAAAPRLSLTEQRRRGSTRSSSPEGLNSIKKIGMINCFFGAWPGWADLFIESCRFNPTVDFFLVSDCAAPRWGIPPNVKIIDLDLQQFSRRASERLGLEIHLSKPYKLNDFKPFWGVIFEEYIKDYDFWGFCDLDIIFGDIRAFMTDELLDKYDVIASRREFITGHFLLFRNTDEIRHLYKRSSDWQWVATSEEFLVFEECGIGLHPRLLQGASFSDLAPEGVVDSMMHVLARSPEIRVHRETICGEQLFILIGGNADKALKIRWESGKIFDLMADKELIYFHFLYLKSEGRLFLPQWETMPPVFLLTRRGFFWVGQQKLGQRLESSFDRALYFLRRSLPLAPKLLKRRFYRILGGLKK